MANSKLSNAKNAKNDEFYTQYSDIEKEISAYLEFDPNVFKGKTILLPCDDPEWSNFTKYFAHNFTNFGLKNLLAQVMLLIAKNIRQTISRAFLKCLLHSMSIIKLQNMGEYLY